MASGDLDFVLSEIRNAIKDSMSTMEKELKNTHQLMVYEAYQQYVPRSGYVRRMDSGGLSAQSNFKTTINAKKDSYELTLENTTVGTGRGRPRLDILITTASPWRSVPRRPFMDRTAKEFDKEATDILRKSLSSRGLTVK